MPVAGDAHIVVALQYDAHGPFKSEVLMMLEDEVSLGRLEPYFRAATAAAVAITPELVSFPPNPPPIRFTRTTTLWNGMPRAVQMSR